MKANDLLDLIGNADDRMIEEARMKRKPSIPRWAKWLAAAACLCLVAGGVFHFANKNDPVENRIQTWNRSFSAADYFRFSDKGDGPSAEMSMADSAIPYAESRDFSDARGLLEENGAIPRMESHPLFNAQANYNADGSLFSLVMSWHRRDRKGLEHYSDLRVTAGHEEVPEIADCILVETDENGAVLETAVTVTERDGVQILARGCADQGKTITFRNETGWYQIAGSWNDSYAEVVALFEWFWDHPIDFSRFQREAGDLYTYTTLAETPDAFSDSLPDFSAFGFVCETSTVTLKNGQPTAFEAVYVSNVTEEQAKTGAYTAGENGVVQIHWCLKAEPDYYDLEGCIGEVGSVSEDQILNLAPPDDVTAQTRIQLRQDDGVLIIYTTDVRQAWLLLGSIR